MDAEIVDVTVVRNLHDVCPGDLLVQGDVVIGAVIAGRAGEIRAQIDGLPDRLARWSWRLDLIATNCGTVPCLPRMAAVMAEFGIRAADRFQVVRVI